VIFEGLMVVHTDFSTSDVLKGNKSRPARGRANRS